VFEVAPAPRARALGLQLLRGVGYRGFAHVEFAHDTRDDQLKLLEVNTRAPVWVGVGASARFNIVRIAYDDLAGAFTGPERVLENATTWVDLGRDLVQAYHLRDLRPHRFARPYLRLRKARAVLAYDDPLPVLVQLEALRQRLARRVAARRLAGTRR
jgi:predicted ATP-grasp superfamily ATP-dependent carboligase